MVKVGVVGCTGAVGEEVVKVLYNRSSTPNGLKVSSLRLFASKRSAGRRVDTEFGEIKVEEFSLDKMEGIDIVFMAVSGSFAKQYAKEIAKKGALVVDNSSAFRYDDDVPLVIPEINGHCIEGHRLIANPNCTTAIAAMALWPIHREFGIKSLFVSTYQAASGAGAEGMTELSDQVVAFSQNKTIVPSVFQYPLIFNVIPHIDSFQDNGYTREEMKVTWETRKIFECPDISVSCTAVRIPTLRAHAEALSVETYKPITPGKARILLERAEGVRVADEPAKNCYPMPIRVSSKYDVEVGRIRQSLVYGQNGLELFVCGDQLLRGAALNAVLIAEFAQKGDFTKPKVAKFNNWSNRQIGLPTAIAAVALSSIFAATCVTLLLKK